MITLILKSVVDKYKKAMFKFVVPHGSYKRKQMTDLLK